MRRAALYVRGRVVVADNHFAALQALTLEERNNVDNIISGFLDEETGEFDSDLAKDHFYNKEMYLVRHGQVEDPEDPDPSVSQEGIKQAEDVAKSLKENDLAEFICFSSPLLRCLQTAEIFADICGIKVEIDLALMETPHFLTQNETFQLKNRHDHFPSFCWDSVYDWLIPYESPSKFIKRVRNVLQQLPRKSIIISHLGIITNMAKLALCDEKAASCGVPTASLTHIDNQEVKCLGWTCSKPMEGKINEISDQCGPSSTC